MRAALSVLLLLAGEAAESPSPAAAPAPDPAALLAAAQVAQRADLEAWSTFRFRRIWRREVRDDWDGAPAEQERLESRIVPQGDRFDEALVRINGAAPTANEMRHHREEAAFTRHYLAMLEGGDGSGSEGGYSLAHFLRPTASRDAGVETLDGVPCRRIDFDADPGTPLGGLKGRFARVMAGSLWITVKGHHLAAARSASVGPVSLYLGIARVHALEVVLKSAPVAGGAWLPRRIEITSRARVLFRTARRHTVFEYTDYEPVDAPARAPP